MRIAVAIHGSAIERVLESYKYLSKGFYMHSTSTQTTAGLRERYPISGVMFPADCSTKPAMHDSVRRCTDFGQYTTGIGMSLHTVPPGWYVSNSPVAFWYPI
jgi:hypothetical protein